jgi:hypothetical protein
MLMMFQETVLENVRMGLTLIHTQDLENVYHHVPHIIYMQIIQQTDVLANALQIHGCMQILTLINVSTSVETIVGLLIIKLKLVFHNALQLGNCGVNVFIGLVFSFAQIIIMLMFFLIDNAIKSVLLQDLLINGHLPV